ncbi:uncharacterized protein [Acropora muricata]|uniref:uncharacterized protein n=1 Tax=Acropora muricata TaxID=159855 RepID=UPI0034E57191
MTNVKQSCENQRVYSDEARHDLELLKTTWLIDEFNQSLKSVVNYREALAHLLNKAPELEDYLKKFLVVLTGDFPTWKYNKIIAEWDPLREPASSVPSFIPWQGPFHISLNVEESTVLLFRPVFEKLYKKLFGQNKVMPKKPKPHRIKTLTTVAFWWMANHPRSCNSSVWENLQRYRIHASLSSS